MKNFSFLPLAPAVTALLLCAPPVQGAQFVADTLSFNVVRDYAAGSNTVDESVTSDADPNQISLETFTREVAQAFDEGLGGVIDFEVRFVGDPLVAVDKTLVTAYTVERFKEDGRSENVVFYRDEVLDNPAIGEGDDPYSGGIADILDGSDERLLYDPFFNPLIRDPGNEIFIEAPVPGYTFTEPVGEDEILATEVIDPDTGASGFYLNDPDRTIEVLHRADRFAPLDDNTVNSFDLAPREINVDGPQLSAELVGRFGEGGTQTLTVYRGPQHFEEQSRVVATPEAPGRRSVDDSINDEYYFGVRTGDDEGFIVPLSGGFMLGGGGNGDATAKDLLFDPREQVVAVGFTNCNFNNFQYYQGPGASPDNTNNFVVDAWFTDGSKEEIRGTTFQRVAGTLDQFFGIRAPEGEFLARLQIRIIGRNSRTFTNIDDFGFIVTPAAPFISDGANGGGVVGRDFFHRVEIQREPTSVLIPDLPAGLSFDPVTGLISGIPQASGTFTSDVIMSNTVGERTETLTLIFVEEDPAVPPAVITSPASAIAILGREFRYEITSDPEAVDSFVIVRRDNGDGTSTLTNLESIGFSLSDGVIFGTALRSDVVARYIVETYVTTRGGSAGQDVILDVFPPTPEPNFDGAAGSTQTDLFFFDRKAGKISITLMPDPEDLPTADLSATTVLTGLSGGTEVVLADFNGDNSTDFITYDPASGISRVHLMDGLTVASRQLSNFGPNSGWTYLGAGDLNIDGVADAIVMNRNSSAVLARLFGTVDKPPSTNNPSGVPVPFLLKAPFVFYPDFFPAKLAALADFDGNGSQDALWRHGNSRVYTFTPFSDTSFTSAVDPYSSYIRDNHQTFTMEAGYVPVVAGDLNGDGSTDLIWENASEGLLAIWLMAGPEVPPAFFDSETGMASAGTDTFVAPTDLAVTITHNDLNGDNNTDLIVQNPSGGAYSGILFEGTSLVGLFQTEFMEDGVTPRPLQLRLDASGAQDIQNGVTFILLERFPEEGQPIPLEPDEALTNYQIYEQARDTKGNLVWDLGLTPFHAVPVADTTRPLPGRDIFFDGMHGPGEALATYSVFERDGDDDQGRPAVKTVTVPPGLELPVQKRIDKPIADLGTESRIWTPVDPSEDGIDYDPRGRRGFLQAADILGNPLFDELGDPIYVPWSNSLGETVPDEPGNVPWELDYDRNFSGAASEIAPGGRNLVLRSKGDFDADSNADLVYEDTTTGEFFIYLMDGLTVLDVIAFSQGFPAPQLITPDSPFRQIEVTSESRWVLWQRANFGTETSPDAGEGEDPDLDLATNLHEYGSGVEDVYLLTPRPVLPAYASSGPFVAEFDLRSDDPELQIVLEVSADLVSWNPVAYTETARSVVDATTDRVTIETDSAPAGEALFYRVRFVLGGL